MDQRPKVIRRADRPSVDLGGVRAKRGVRHPRAGFPSGRRVRSRAFRETGAGPGDASKRGRGGKTIGPRGRHPEIAKRPPSGARTVTEGTSMAGPTRLDGPSAQTAEIGCSSAGPGTVRARMGGDGRGGERHRLGLRVSHSSRIACARADSKTSPGGERRAVIRGGPGHVVESQVRVAGRRRVSHRADHVDPAVAHEGRRLPGSGGGILTGECWFWFQEGTMHACKAPNRPCPVTAGGGFPRRHGYMRPRWFE